MISKEYFVGSMMAKLQWIFPTVSALKLDDLFSDHFAEIYDTLMRRASGVDLARRYHSVFCRIMPISNDFVISADNNEEFSKRIRKVLYDILDVVSDNFEVRMSSAPYKGKQEITITPPTIHPSIRQVIFNGPATIVFFEDGDKVVVKCSESDIYSYEDALMAAILKKLYGKEIFKYMKKTIAKAKFINMPPIGANLALEVMRLGFEEMEKKLNETRGEDNNG